ncbi:MAG: glycosyltransferase [Gammaproteobacteria bacterium]|nr:glycosyltransferase [Gammaproteobacteria bacterium]
MKISALSAAVVTVAFALLTLGAWSLFNLPRAEPPWPVTLQGIAFSPFRLGQDATMESWPSVEEIDADLALLAGKAHAVRTYSTDGPLAEVPRLAKQHHLNVMLGAWLDRRLDHNEREIQNLIRLAEYRNVVRLVVGNEALLRGDVPLETLIRYLDRVRAAKLRPVSTAETWHTWMRTPQLAEHVDYIAVHILPYWEGVPVEQAVQYVARRIDELKARFPGKPIVISEVGWPSGGRTRVSAEASTANQAMFLRRFLRFASEEKYTYYVLEAFDQPWKRTLEGAVGEYWGIYNVARQPKFPLREPIVRLPQWRTLAGISIAIGAILLFVFYVTSRTLDTGGRAFLATIVYGTATLAVWVTYEYMNQYHTMTSLVVGGLLLLSMLGVIAILLAEAHEWAEAYWVTSRHRSLAPQPGPGLFAPKVSIHVPAYNEPPAMLIETLTALSRLDYPDFEVIVIDNNTRDEAVWRPVEEHCANLGPRFRFFHLAPLSGFKAGALNFALRQAAADAQIVAVIDSDYAVDHNWLGDLVSRFDDPDVAIVQAPQDYRDFDGSAFKAMCFAEYRGFFHIGMVTRNERNAIIQHGTMTMVRRSALDQIGGWAEWCITEDTELGLRIFEAGLEAEYVPASYGRGLMPDRFLDFKKQRYRWAYGAMQIMKRHLPQLLFNWRSRLTAGQRYHFLAGWLPWIADGANLLFNLGAIGWSAAMILYPRSLDAPVMAFSALPLALFAFKVAKMVHLYLNRVGANLVQTLAAAVAGLSLSHTIGCAVLRGLVTQNEPFFRTPKHTHSGATVKALLAARDEALLLLALLLAANALHEASAFHSQEMRMWVVVLCVQALPYAATLLTSILSAFPLPARMIGRAGARLTTRPAV